MQRGPGRPKGAIQTAHIGLRIEPELKERMARLAAIDDRSLAQWVIRALRAACEAEEARIGPIPAPKKKAAAR
jgi:predicted HicB family RNase H-like nuclease